MRLLKTYEFHGIVTSALGLCRKRVIGKTIRGIITVAGTADDFTTQFNRVFRIGGSIIESPRVSVLFPGNDLMCDGHPYILRDLSVKDMVEDKESRIDLSFKVVPWDKIEKMRFFCKSKSWWKKLFVDEVRIEGEAVVSKSEQIPDIVARKR